MDTKHGVFIIENLTFWIQTHIAGLNWCQKPWFLVRKTDLNTDLETQNVEYLNLDLILNNNYCKISKVFRMKSPCTKFTIERDRNTSKLSVCTVCVLCMPCGLLPIYFGRKNG